MFNISRNLVLMQQLAISNNNYLYIDLRYSLINIDFILITNNNKNALYNRKPYYTQFKEKRYINKHLRFRKILTISTISIFTLQFKKLKAFKSILRDNINNKEDVKNNKNNLNNI